MKNFDFNQINNRYFVMRHGQSLANVKKIIVSSPDNGINGYGLTDQGRAQARSAVARCRDLGADTLIFTSDFMRARQTAAIAQEGFGVSRPMEETPLLRERFFGDFELTRDANYKKVWDQDARAPETPGNGVEPVASVLSRVLRLVSDIEKKENNRDVLLVSHGDTLQIFLTFLKGWPPSRHREIDHLDVAQIRPAMT